MWHINNSSRHDVGDVADSVCIAVDDLETEE